MPGLGMELIGEEEIREVLGPAEVEVSVARFHSIALRYLK